jgi:gliding motility-associated-like protein
MKYDLIIIGTGPGGYVAAIRASQLGMNVAVVERENLGGICLNWGCIPTKALLKSAQVFEYVQHASDYGIQLNEAKADFPAMIKRSRGVADGMSKGIQFLLKKNKITVLTGDGSLVSANTVSVTDATGCELKDTLYINPGTCCENIFLPNAFSPNGDGNNDEWRMTTSTGLEIEQFAIFNRYGQKIWTTIDQRRGWDGTHWGKEAEPGTYFYILRYKCLSNGEKYTKKGDFILVK